MSSHHDLEENQEEVDESTLVARARSRFRGSRSSRCLSEEDCLYRMDHRRRGVAAIFNQRVFDGSTIHTRIGSEHDCVILRRSYARLGFEVETYVDLTLAGIQDRLMELSERDHSDCDCFLFTFMSHGLEGKLRAKDQVFDVNLLWDSFTPERCPSLANKPKIFIIQAGQDHGRQRWVLDSLPRQAEDFLLGFSTIPDVPLSSSSTIGSLYIERLCLHLDRYGFTIDLHTLLNKVSELALDCRLHNRPLPFVISMNFGMLRFTKKSTLQDHPGQEEEAAGE